MKEYFLSYVIKQKDELNGGFVDSGFGHATHQENKRNNSSEVLKKLVSAIAAKHNLCSNQIHVTQFNKVD